MIRVCLMICMIISLGIFGCDRQSPQPPDPTDLEIVTGLLLVDGLGQPLGVLGNPNEKNPRDPFFPNPFKDNVLLQTEGSSIKYWLIPAEKDTNFQNIDFDSLFLTLPIDTAEISDLSQRAGNLPDSLTTITINTDGLPDGFYKGYVLYQNGEIGWTNLYKSTGSVNFQELSDSLSVGWE